MKNYSVKAIRSGKYWHLEIEGLSQGTQARTLDEAGDMATDLIHIVTGEALENIRVSVLPQLPDDIAEIQDEAKKLFAQAKETNALAAAKSRTVAHLLREQGLTYKDIGKVLDISYQRAAQLAS